MIKSLAFWDVIADALGVDRSSVDRAARSLRGAGLIGTGVGRHAPDVTPRDAARYLIAFLGSGRPTHATETVARFSTLPAVETTGLATVCDALDLPRAHTLGDALEALLARLPELLAAEETAETGLWWVTVNERRRSATITLGDATAEYFDARPFEAMRANAAARSKALDAGDARALEATIEADHAAQIEAGIGARGIRIERTATQYEFAPIAEALRL